MTELEQLIAWLDRVGASYYTVDHDDVATIVFIGDDPYESNGVMMEFDKYENVVVDINGILC